jgi:DNA-directed RNA polymerase, mitochondrial
MVVADRSIESSEEAEKLIQLLSKAAVTLNLSKVVTELGQAEALGSTAYDPLGDVPEVVPVTVVKVCFCWIVYAICR